MAKPIKLTENLIIEAVAEFEESIRKAKIADGKFNYSKSYSYKDDGDKASVMFTPAAFAKMLKLIMDFSTEVAWHGAVQRVEGNNFLITDILVYPQTVSGATVEMDTEKYSTWLMENYEDERFNSLFMQGHSHVNMGTSPSVTDITHQEEILGQLTDDMFYIFMIWNKSLEQTTKIYDLLNNTLYENADIVCSIVGTETPLEDFISEAKELVKTKTYTPPGSSSPTSYGGYYNGSYYNTSQTQSKEDKSGIKSKAKDKAKYGNGWQGRGTDSMEDIGWDLYGEFPTT